MEKQEHKKLTAKQKRFCEEYVLDWNATRAYQEAYPESSYDSSNSSSARLLVNASIQAYIKEIQEDIAKLAGLSKLGVLNELKEIIEEDNKEMVATRDKIKALEVVNKMLGFNNPEQTESKNTLEVRGVEPIKWVDDNGK